MPGRRESDENGLRLMDWIIIAGTLISVTAVTTAYAFTNFQLKADARDDKMAIHEELKELRENLKSLNVSQGIGYTANPKAEPVR